jgi:hypothetical protein
MITYKPIESSFTKNGFQFRQINRDGDVAVFHKAAIKGPLHPLAFDAGFETVVITRHDGYEIAGVKMEPAEQYPGNEMWGTRGWTFPNLLSALNKFEHLLGKSVAPVEAVDDEDNTAPVVNTSPVVASGHRGRTKGERPSLTVPGGDFSVKDLALANKVEYPVAFFLVK